MLFQFYSIIPCYIMVDYYYSSRDTNYVYHFVTLSSSIHIHFMDVSIGIFSSVCGLPVTGRYHIQEEILLSGDKFVRHGAVGARLIHASAHARLRRWGAFKLLPYALTCPNPGRWRFLSLRGAGLCTYRTRPCKVLALL